MSHDEDARDTTRALRIVVRHGLPLRKWHSLLAARLRAAGHRVRFEAVGRSQRERLGIHLLLALERRLYRAQSSLFAVTAATPDEAAPDGEALDLAINVSGRPSAELQSLQLLFDDAPGEDALLAALLDGRSPVIAVHGSVDGTEKRLAVGHPAIEDRLVLARSLDHVLPRVVTLLVQAVGRFTHDSLEPPLISIGVERSAGSPLTLLARSFSERLWRKISRRQSCGWGIAYRVPKGPGVAATQSWQGVNFARIDCDASRFYADPFAFEEGGRRHILFEDFPFATRKGVIAHVEITADGRATVPRTVLELPVHLSYPLLIRHAGAVYMLPEMSAARRLQLFRAERFPDRWVADQILLDDTIVADATPIFHAGSWWMFATLSDDGGSTWDQLALYHAPDLMGPWTPHAANPVLIDAGSARPAGAMWHEDGVLMRVAQDCRDGYGRGIAVCRVDRLDLDGFAQTVVARLGAPAGSAGFGAHTLNRDGELEVIDLNLMPA